MHACLGLWGSCDSGGGQWVIVEGCRGLLRKVYGWEASLRVSWRIVQGFRVVKGCWESSRGLWNVREWSLR